MPLPAVVPHPSRVGSSVPQLLAATVSAETASGTAQPVPASLLKTKQHQAHANQQLDEQGLQHLQQVLGIDMSAFKRK